MAHGQRQVAVDSGQLRQNDFPLVSFHFSFDIDQSGGKWRKSVDLPHLASIEYEVCQAICAFNEK